MDIQINVSRETPQDEAPKKPVNVEEMRRHITIAREIQAQRLSKADIYTNAEINFKNIDKYCILEPEAERMLQNAITAKNLSMRTYHKVKKLGRTMADLDGSEIIRENHIAEALAFRVNESMFSELA